jgi:Fe-S cluster assembly protein SufD
MLRAILAEFEELGSSGGGAIDAAARRTALESYMRWTGVRERFPPRWRHDYAALSFDELRWSSGRARVPVLPKYDVRARERDTAPADADRQALAVENAGGIVHLGSTFLEPRASHGDARIVITALADAMRASPERVRAVAGRIVSADADRFTSLATAFQNCGAFIEVPANVALEAPLQMVWASRPGEASAVFPRVVVRLGAGARATILERHVGSTESFVCGMVEVLLEPGAELDYVVVQQADEGARIIIRRGARCERDARLGWHVAELGGALARTTLSTRLEHARSAVAVNALFFARDFAHVDLAVDVAHRASRTASATIVRNVTTGRGQSRFHGAITIVPDTQRCDAAMRDDALVLSRGGYHEAVPALDIASDEVSAQHAATIGALEEEALFYVQSRGIPRATAARMIALAFFEPAVVGFPSDGLRDEIRSLLDAELDAVQDTFLA